MNYLGSHKERDHQHNFLLKPCSCKALGVIGDKFFTPLVLSGSKSCLQTFSNFTSSSAPFRAKDREKCAVPDGTPYRENPLNPVFLWAQKAFDAVTLVRIMLTTFDQDVLCVAPPNNIAHNVSFLVESSKLQSVEDIKCDSMGAWTYKGKPRRRFAVVMSSENVVESIRPLPAGNCHNGEETYTLTRTYYVNSSDDELRKTIVSLEGKTANGFAPQLSLAQTLFAKFSEQVKEAIELV